MMPSPASIAVSLIASATSPIATIARYVLRPGVGQEDRAVVRVQQLLRVARDPVHHRGEVERRRDVAAHLGQRGGLARAALGLVEEARVLERDAHRVGQRLQQAHVRLAERVLAVA